MPEQTLKERQAICFLTVFMCGSSIIIGGTTKTGQDSWMCLLVAQLFAVPMLMLYARIMWLFPEKNIYQIAEYVFGKFFGNIITVLFIWYSFHLSAMVLRNFSEFMQLVAMPETPQLALMLINLFTAVYMAKKGVEVMGKWVVVVICVLNVTILSTLFLLYNQVDFTNLMPVLNHSTKEFLECGYSLSSFPFMETIVFLGIADSVRRPNSPFKIYGLSIFFTSVILAVIMLRNIVSLGPAMLKSVYFPSYVSARIIDVSDFLVRIEGSISLNFIITGSTKIALCLLTACRGIAYLFRIDDYRKILLPVALAVTALCVTLYENTMQMMNFIKIYPIYAFPFQVGIPLLIWISGEIRNRGKQADPQGEVKIPSSREKE